VLWPPRGVDWFMAMGFAVGSLCFALGAIPGYARLVGPGPDAITYFIGSIFFTTAGYLQFFECINAGRGPGERRRFGAVQPGRIDWWATAIQFLGTLFFNISTFDATRTGLSAHGSNVYVWAPDVLGSICFLVSGGIAYAAVRRQGRALTWWIGVVNLAGCVAFGISAVAGYVVHSTGDALDLAAANSWTSLGALCFLVGSVLLLPASSN
jgi:hypothetical protein